MDRSEQPNTLRPAPARPVPFLAGTVLAVAIAGCSIWANLSFTIRNPANFRYIPPFQANANYNRNSHLGAEYFNIARALAAGKGFANPFLDPTGPTAWQPPLFPSLLAGLLWAFDGNQQAVMVVVIVLQVLVLIGTGLLVLALARQTTRQLGAGVAATAFFLALWCPPRHFWLCFQLTHDSWLVMLALDLLLAGLCWGRPLHGWWRAAGWGLFGGLAALISPIAGFVWGSCSLLAGWHQRNGWRLVLAGLVAGLTLVPWTVRNYLVLGRLVPVKSNLAFELYQSQCLQPEGLIQGTFRNFPSRADGPEGRSYRKLGEMAYLERKWQQYWQAVWADPVDFLDRLASRFLGATLWYVPFDSAGESRRPWALWMSRLTHPLPFLAVLVLLTALWERLLAAQWAAIAIYFLYLLPYVWASYYERYGLPLLGIKVLLVLWAADRLLSLWRKERTKSGQRQAIPLARQPSGASCS